MSRRARGEDARSGIIARAQARVRAAGAAVAGPFRVVPAAARGVAARWQLALVYLWLAVGLPFTIFGISQAAPFVVDHPYFAVRDIVITPTEHVRPGTLLAWAGVREGTSIWRLAPARLAARLEAYPWVRHATVRRELPNRLVIAIEEHRPAAIVLVDQLYYVDRRGVVFAQLDERDPLDLPLVTGVEAPILEGDGHYVRHAVRHALRLVERMPIAGLPFRVSEINIERDGGITVFPVTPRLTLAFGWRQLPEKLDRLREVLMTHAGREGQIREINLTFAAQAVVRMRKAARETPRAGA